MGRMTRETYLAIAHRSQSSTAGTTGRPLWDHITSPRPMMTPAVSRALDVPDVLRGNIGATTPPTLPGGGGGRDGNAPRHTTVNISIRALDGSDVERVMKQKVIPRLKFMMRTNEDGMRAIVRETALT
jgi:hypothetical protein